MIGRARLRLGDDGDGDDDDDDDDDEEDDGDDAAPASASASAPLLRARLPRGREAPARPMMAYVESAPAAAATASTA